ncbi:MAG TPA: recombination mediator RecR [Bryobacteraceae bacterium]|jgi:recombination protein RecR|nr:recombination mediator RecR [Bryobacteraceae bacterium]
MPDFAEPLQRLIDEFRRLPGIGQKSAQRLAFHVLRSPRENAARLGAALIDVKDNLGICAECNNISDAELCPYCRDPHRDRSQICVIEEPHNILPIETTRTFEGVYHVLSGAISPLRGIGPEQLKIKGLLDRISNGDVKEIILATNPTVEGEATAVYLSRLLKPLGMRVTRIAMGIPVGSDLEFSDEVTISKSLENRREM